ncbi:hypothetical protein H4W30_007250 [Amycolatopsis roodepoortensis]|uniref:Uncharacterized protein n=1 Tax=Amycolatopsis roodepoortensis TaxID=700274 RepID=A0ABR9LHN0_9PSEU|nr:hypothetical protein [Amycolatopsis roodepoortensis]
MSEVDNRTAHVLRVKAPFPRLSRGKGAFTRFTEG